MARESNKLNAKAIEATTKAGISGLYRDGGGLMLQVVGGSATWLLRVTVKGKRRELGLGSARDVTLKDAREKAADMRKDARAGRDPTVARKAAGLTFAEAAKQVHALKLAEWSEGKHQDQWINTLETYAFPFIGNKLVSEIEPADVTRVLRPIWHTKSETARRVCQRIRVVFDWATTESYRPQQLVNPAMPVKDALGKQTDVVEHHPAVPWRDVPAFLAKVRETPSVESTRWALEFLLLTAARSKEVRLARWPEIDLDAACWTKPAAHMKGRKGKRVQHRVPLSTQAIALLRAVRARWPNSTLLFPGRDLKGPLSNMAMEMLMRRLPDVLSDTPGRPPVPHGLRSSFKDWSRASCAACVKQGKPCRHRWDDDLSEDALAHIEPSKTKQAYGREDLYEGRKPLMQAWADFATGKQAKAATATADAAAAA